MSSIAATTTESNKTKKNISKKAELIVKLRKMGKGEEIFEEIEISSQNYR